MKTQSELDKQIYQSGLDQNLIGTERLDWLKSLDPTMCKPVVLVVHGTFAARPSDIGANFQDKAPTMDMATEEPTWWQKDGVLGSAVCAHGMEYLSFQWSGANSELARRNAGKRLWRLLQRLDGLKIPFAVISHSHGGNVVWNALCYGDNCRESKLYDFNRDRQGALPTEPPIPARDLIHLRHWVTVGTPFLHFRPAFQVGLLRISREAILTGFIASLSLFGLYVFWNVSEDVREYEGILHPILIVAFSAFVLISFFVFLASCVTEDLKGIQGQTIARLYREKAFSSLWSRHDEAIGMLKAAFKDVGNVIPAIRLSAQNKEGGCQHWHTQDFANESPGIVALFVWPMKLIIACTINVVSRFFVNPFLVRRARAVAFGDDFVGRKCHKVTTGPERNYEPIDDSSLMKFVGAEDQEVAEKTRRLVYEISEQGLAGVFSQPQEFSVRLVHNSYFDHKETREKILRITREALFPASSDEMDSEVQK